MTVVLRLMPVTSVRDDSHPIVLDLCDNLLRLRIHFWRAGWTDRGCYDRHRHPAQLAGAERPAGMEDHQHSGHAGRSGIVDRPVGVDAQKPALLADMDGGGANAHYCIAPRHLGLIEFRAKKLCRAGDGLGDPMPPLHGLRDCARPSRHAAAAPLLAGVPTLVSPQIGRNTQPCWRLTGNRRTGEQQSWRLP